MKADFKVLKMFFIYLFFLFFFWLVFNLWGIFSLYPNLDILFHFLGGYITALGIFGFFKEKILSSDKIVALGFIIGGVAIVGICWEIFEWLLDNLILKKPAYFQASTGDMLSDLIMDILGALGKNGVNSIFRK